jgi:membrane-associated phospholipid phosphatase
MGSLKAQEVDEIYNFNYWYDIPSVVVGIAFNAYGQQYLRGLPLLDSSDYINFTPGDINGFDRSATEQDPAYANEAHSLSDIALRVVPVLPFALGFDKEIRKDALNLTLLYLQMHSYNTSLYLISAMSIRRNRPFLYNPDEIYERKSGPKSTDSFYSGHVSVVTASSFFMAKVFLDYHPEHKNRRWLFYSLATLPSIYTGYFRYRAGKHFPTDLIVGYAIGAAVGILTPELHKSKLYNKTQITPTLGLNSVGFNIRSQF